MDRRSFCIRNRFIRYFFLLLLSTFETFVFCISSLCKFLFAIKFYYKALLTGALLYRNTDSIIKTCPAGHCFITKELFVEKMVVCLALGS